MSIMDERLEKAIQLATRTEHEPRCNGPWVGWLHDGRCNCLKRELIEHVAEIAAERERERIAAEAGA